MDRDTRMISKVTRISILYDFYGKLLTERQREMLELHYFDDWSLSEIAEHVQVSRQAVHDNLRRSEEQLEHYETVLHLLAEHTAREAKVDELGALLSVLADNFTQEQVLHIQRALDAIRSDTGLVMGGDAHA